MEQRAEPEGPDRILNTKNPASPLSPRHLLHLFVRPTRFFSSQLALNKTPYFLLVTWCYGMTQAISRIDREMLRADAGQVRTS